MTTGQKIAALRRERGMTQDALAEALSVTRQAVSKWEADAALPETGKLLPLARLLGCTADYLLGSSEAEAGAPQGAPNTAAQSSEPKGAPQGCKPNTAQGAPNTAAQSSEPKGAPQGCESNTAQGAPNTAAQGCEPNTAQGAQQEPAREKTARDEAAQKEAAHDEAAREEPAQGRAPFTPYWGLPRRYVWASDFEYKSKRTLFGLPLVHINGKWGGTAKGVVAVGFKACGVVSVGFLSMGVLSAGCLSLGAVSLGALALGVLALGAVSVGLLLALGAVAAGFVAYGAAAFGGFAAGAFACARYVAVGDHACALIPIAKTFAWGGAVHDFYFLFTAGMPGLQVGYFEGGAFVEGGAALQEACAQYVPAWLQWLAEAFCRLRLY